MSIHKNTEHIIKPKLLYMFILSKKDKTNAKITIILFEIVGCPCTTRYTDHAIPALQGMYLWDEMGRRGLSKNGSIHFAHIFVANDL